VVPVTTFWSAHTHSRFSAIDALPAVPLVVARAVELGYPALGLTDHGNMAGAAQLYTAATKAGIKPLPGIEAYVTHRRGVRGSFMHMGLLSVTPQGYRNLVAVNNYAHANFWYRPALDFGDLAKLSGQGLLEGIAAMSGCWFGAIPTLLREGDPVAVRNLLVALDGWFGEGLYVEMQHHAIPDNDEAAHAATLHRLATELGLPCVITQDSHYVHDHERGDHDTLKTLTSWSEDPDSAVFPGDGYHMVDGTWMANRFTSAQLAAGLEGLSDLEAKASVRIPELDEFHLAVPDVGARPDTVLRQKVLAALDERVETGAVKAAKKAAYSARIEEELDVIAASGMAGYLLLDAEVSAWMKDQDIFTLVRGSASGSLVCWLLGSTYLDPIVWELPFDRFLSRNRTKPPDIDHDVEHRRRQEVVDYLFTQWHCRHIGTWMQLKLQAEDGEDEKGALLVKWRMRRNKLGLDPAVKPTESEMRALVRVARHEPYGGYGVHPAGIMITPDEASAAAVPLMWVASSGTMVTAFDMDDVEKLGRVKLDILGVKTLTAIKAALDLLGLRLEDIPLRDKTTFQMINGKDLWSVFQLEGGAMSRGIRELRPTKIADLVAAMALYRPATMKSGATERYIARRRGKEPVPERHPIIDAATKQTYGVVLFQEQVLGILKQIGFTVDEIERARKAVKASNDKVAEARQIMSDLMARMGEAGRAAGMDDADIAFLEEAFRAYADYGFNKAHSASYGFTAYITAYLRANHPLEWWAGVLTAYGASQSKMRFGLGRERRLLKQSDAYPLAARADGVKLQPAHVNASDAGWSVDYRFGAIRKGLRAIDRLGEKAVEELLAQRPFADLDDLAERVSARCVTGASQLRLGHSPASCGGVIAALDAAGALKGLEFDPLKQAERERIRQEKEAKKAAAAAKRQEKQERAAARAAEKTKEPV
jgi:DNA polymerase III subunit alpha